MTEAELAAFVAEKARMATEVLLADGDHPPVAFLIPPGGAKPEMLVITRGATNVVRARARAVGAVGALSIVQLRESPAAVVEWGVRPTQDPQSRELLCVSWEFRSGDRLVEGCWQQYFGREGGRPVLAETRLADGALRGMEYVDLMD